MVPSGLIGRGVEIIFITSDFVNCTAIFTALFRKAVKEFLRFICYKAVEFQRYCKSNVQTERAAAKDVFIIV